MRSSPNKNSRRNYSNKNPIRRGILFGISKRRHRRHPRKRELLKKSLAKVTGGVQLRILAGNLSEIPVIVIIPAKIPEEILPHIFGGITGRLPGRILRKESLVEFTQES